MLQSNSAPSETWGAGPYAEIALDGRRTSKSTSISSGIQLWLVGLRFGNTWIEAHTLSSVVMILAAGVHTLSHLRRSAAAAVEEVTAHPSREALTRRSLVVASLVLGSVLAAASLLYSTPFPPAAAGT